MGVQTLSGVGLAIAWPLVRAIVKQGGDGAVATLGDGVLSDLIYGPEPEIVDVDPPFFCAIRDSETGATAMQPGLPVRFARSLTSRVTA